MKQNTERETEDERGRYDQNLSSIHLPDSGTWAKVGRSAEVGCGMRERSDIEERQGDQGRLPTRAHSGAMRLLGFLSHSTSQPTGSLSLAEELKKRKNKKQNKQILLVVEKHTNSLTHN